jgi:hypothetical protein
LLDRLLAEIEAHSSLTSEDNLRVIATHYAITNRNFNCNDCLLKHSEERRTKLKGCAGPIKLPVAKYKDRVVFYKCPSNFYSAYVAEIMGHARHFESGLLPYAGGLLEQPAKYVELINLIGALRIEDELTRAEAAAREAKKASKRKGR